MSNNINKKIENLIGTNKNSSKWKETSTISKDRSHTSEVRISTSDTCEKNQNCKNKNLNRTKRIIFNLCKKFNAGGEWHTKYEDFLMCISKNYNIHLDHLKYLHIHYLNDGKNIIISNRKTYDQVLGQFMKTGKNVMNISIDISDDYPPYIEKLDEYCKSQIKNKINQKCRVGGEKLPITEEVNHQSLTPEDKHTMKCKTVRLFRKLAKIEKRKRREARMAEKESNTDSEDADTTKNVKPSFSNQVEENLRKTINDQFDKLQDLLTKKLTPLVNSVKTLDILGSKCTACKNLIIRIRYVCPQCPDYFLCDSCEEKQNHVHDLIKQRNPNNPYIITKIAG